MLVETLLVMTCKAITIERKIQGAASFSAMFSTIVETTPEAKMMRYALNASTLPGKSLPISAPVFVWIKV